MWWQDWQDNIGVQHYIWTDWLLLGKYNTRMDLRVVLLLCFELSSAEIFRWRKILNIMKYWILNYSAVVKEIQQNGNSFDSFISSGDFKDFDKYFNFGNKFSASTYPPTVLPTRSAAIVKPTKPWKQTYNSDNRPRKQLDRNSENSQAEKQHYKKIVQTKADDSQRLLPEVEKNPPKQEDTRGQKDGAENIWSGEVFDDFSTFLDKSELSVTDWYPWENKDQKKNKMEPIEIIYDRKRKIKPTKNTLTPSNLGKTLNLNSLDKATVYQICKKTKSRDVTNLCKEYSLNNAREVKSKIKPAMKKKKPLRKRKKAKRPQKKADKTKTRKHLFFESGLSFRRRKSERSRSLLETLTSQMTRLLWPGRSGRRFDNNEKNVYQARKHRGNSNPGRDWLMEAATTISRDWHY